MSSDFTRLSTVIRLHGGGHEGVGEDVTYDALDHVALQEAGPVQPLAGSVTIARFCEHVGELDLFPRRAGARGLAALPPLGFRERGARPGAAPGGAARSREALGREPRPVTFVVSLRLGNPPTIEPVRKRLERYPTLRFKLDPTQRVDRRADRGAGRDGRSRLGRLQGPLQGHRRRPAARPRPLPAGDRGVPGGVDRGPRRSPTRRAPCSSRTATASRGTRRSTRSPTSRRCRSRRRW